jgi:hypothetical protein
MTHNTFVAIVAASGATALGLAGPSAAAPAPQAELGQHIAFCAQESLGQRESPPSVTCVHDGMAMSFPTFGAMVQHMREMHGG